MHIFCQKNISSPKSTVLLCYSFQLFREKTLYCQAQIWSKERGFCQNYTIVWATKINRMLFFSIFHEKNHSSHAQFLLQKRPFSKNTTLSCPYFVEKISIPSKSQCSHVILFQFFSWKTPCCSCPYVQKNGNSPTLHYMMGEKSQ